MPSGLGIRAVTVAKPEAVVSSQIKVRELSTKAHFLLARFDEPGPI